MLNKNMIEKFKNFENDVNNFDVFQFFTFNEFVKSQCNDFESNDINIIINDCFELINV